MQTGRQFTIDAACLLNDETTIASTEGKGFVFSFVFGVCQQEVFHKLAYSRIIQYDFRISPAAEHVDD